MKTAYKYRSSMRKLDNSDQIDRLTTLLIKLCTSRQAKTFTKKLEMIRLMDC